MLSLFLQSRAQQRVPSFFASLLVIFLASPALNWKATATSYPYTKSGSGRSSRCAASPTAFVWTLRVSSGAPRHRLRTESRPLSDDICCMETEISAGFLGGRDRRKLRPRWSAGTFRQLSVATILADGTGVAAGDMRSPDAGVAGNGADPGDYLALAPIEVIDSMDTYFQVLSANADKIVVVKIYAGFCRACKAFDKKYRALALEYEEAGADIKFFEMDWMPTRDLCKSLQVKKLPHMEIYAGERGRLASFVCGPSKSGLLKEKIDRLLADPSDPSLGAAPPALSSAPLGPP